MLNVILRPRYLVLASCGSISICMSLIVVWDFASLPFLCFMLLKIFVLSGWSANPTACDTVLTSRSMLHSCCRVDPTKRTSSANRRLVRVAIKMAVQLQTAVQVAEEARRM